MFVDRNVYCSHGCWRKMNRAIVLCSSMLWAVTCRKSINNSLGKIYLATAYNLKRKACRCVGLGQRASARSSPVCRQPAKGRCCLACLFQGRGGRRGGRAASRARVWWMGKGDQRRQPVPRRESGSGAAGLEGEGRERRGRVWAAAGPGLAEQRAPRQGERGRPEPPGQKEGWIAGMEPARPQPRPSALPVPGAPGEEGGAAGLAFPSTRNGGKRGAGCALRWKPSILQVQPHVTPTSGVMSSGFPGENAFWGG